MIEETPLLKRLAFKQSDTHFLTMWADWRDPTNHKTIIELVRRKDGAVRVNEPYDYSDLAIKHWITLSEKFFVEHPKDRLKEYKGKPCVDCGCTRYKDIEGWPQYVECQGCLQSKPREKVLCRV